MKVTNICLANLRGTMVICSVYLVWLVVVIVLFTATSIHNAIKVALVFVSCLLAAPIIGLFFVHRDREQEARIASFFSLDRSLDDIGTLPPLAKTESAAAVVPVKNAGEGAVHVVVVADDENKIPRL